MIYQKHLTESGIKGLVYKMIKMQLPRYLISWTRSFLNSRSFCVNVNGKKRKDFPIGAGLPQGSVISPLLFSIFINDIPRKDKTNNEYSLFFADDLVTFLSINLKETLSLGSIFTLKNWNHG